MLYDFESESKFESQEVANVKEGKGYRKSCVSVRCKCACIARSHPKTQNHLGSAHR